MLLMNVAVRVSVYRQRRGQWRLRGHRRGGFQREGEHPERQRASVLPRLPLHEEWVASPNHYPAGLQSTTRVVVASVLQAFLCFPLVFFLLFMSTLNCIFLTNVVFHVLFPLSPDDACLGVGGSNNINKHPLCLPLSGGLMIPWRRRWCVLKDETFMWFRAKQDSVKSGWLYKKGGGMSTLSRRNWKMRWFVLRESKLMYFENDTEEKLKGTIDVRTAK